MLQGRHYILYGVSRLATRVARALAANHATLTLIRPSAGDDALLGRLPPETRVVEGDGEEALRAAGAREAACLLALGEDDLENLRAAVAARAVSPDLPVVLRTFDPSLADQLEQGLNIRRAYSMSALAAPAFVAAAFGDQVLETLRLGDGEAPICRVRVRPGSPLAGLTLTDLKRRHGCAVLARAGDTGEWRPALEVESPGPLAPGEEVLIGGPLLSVLRLSALNVGLLDRTRRRPRPRRPAGSRHRDATPTLLPWVAAGLVAVLALSVLVFSLTLRLRLVDAIYFVITTATTTGYGDISLKDSPDWLKLFGNVVMLSGGALLGILFSYLAALATAERLEDVMGRRAARLSGHIVVAGLGNVGYRVAGQLTELGLDVVVLERRRDSRFAEAVRARAPVLTGDVRLPENLERASVAGASVIIACTDDDLANIQACLHARRLNPGITTVARVFDDQLADQITQAFAITHALSASQVAVGAFVGAATDERALRPLRVGGLDLLACRYTAESEVGPGVIGSWRAEGVRLLALRAPAGPVRPPSELHGPLCPGDEVILCGPAEAVRRIMAAPLRN